MSIVHLQSVEILNAEARFVDPYIFKITFECISPLQDDLEWKLVYVGSAGDEKYDQELDNCMVGPCPLVSPSLPTSALRFFPSLASLPLSLSICLFY